MEAGMQGSPRLLNSFYVKHWFCCSLLVQINSSEKHKFVKMFTKITVLYSWLVQLSTADNENANKMYLTYLSGETCYPRMRRHGRFCWHCILYEKHRNAIASLFFFPQKGAENYTFSRVLKYLGRKLGHWRSIITFTFLQDVYNCYKENMVEFMIYESSLNRIYKNL